MSELQTAFDEFRNDLTLTAETTGELQASAFFDLYSHAAIESGDISDIEYCPARSESKSFQIDGYSLNRDQGELTLAICDFHEETEIQSINAVNVESLFENVQRFYDSAIQSEFINGLEETSPTFQAAYLVYSKINEIKRVRVIIFSNARLGVRKQLATMKEIHDIRFSFNVLDFQRYLDIQSSRIGTDSVEIDLEEIHGSLLPCLPAHSGSDEYASYLVVLPGKLLADIYGKYGARLLEQNVRTFLQARTKVNKGIIQTIKEAPDKFFAYNNGLTATASNIELVENESRMEIKAIKDFQIVNGGQTTASILYASDKEDSDLKDVFVQMKLSVVKPELIENIVPKISRYANTQNKISAADFFSSHPFHLEIEKISRRLPAPPKEGSLFSTNWFYERARGQYKDEQAYLSQAERNKFQKKFPREQMVVKTDLAKYEISFACHPDIVCKGAQKCFMYFADIIDKEWESNSEIFGDGYFKDAMARALIFRWTDKMTGSSEWYKADRGYKAQTVAYTIAVISYLLKQEKVELDYRGIWNRQVMPEKLGLILEEIARKVSKIIRDAPEHVRNVGEYCKTLPSWARVQSQFRPNLKEQLQGCLVDVDEVRQRKSDDKKIKKIDNGIDAQTKVSKIPGGKWKIFAEEILKLNIITPKELRILGIAAQMPNKYPTEKQSLILMEILRKAEQEGIEIIE
jgi:hypothetical protein